MKITVFTPSGNIFELDVDPTETVENVKALIEVESSILHAEQTIKFEGKVLQNQQTLQAAGLKDGEMIVVERTRAAPPRAPTSSRAPMDMANSLASQLQQGLQAALRGGPPAQFGPGPAATNVHSRVDPESYRQYVKSSPDMLRQLQENDPELARAVLSENKQILADLLNRRAMERQRAEMERQRLLTMLDSDPYNLELQAKIEKIIQQQQVDQNMEMAIEHNPEAFGRVVMLYVDCEVNNKPIKAFVDSGAQQTIMSASCAKRVGIYRLMDSRFAGIAKGVGTAKILGRVHMTTIKIGKSFFPISVTILEDPSMEFLLGLDMLRRHQCSIDLRENVLRIGSENVPFLGEGDLPMHLRDANNEQPEEVSPGGYKGNSSVANTPENMAPQAPVSEESIKSLVEMGFTRDQAIEALRVCNGNPDLASDYLLNLK